MFFRVNQSSRAKTPRSTLVETGEVGVVLTQVPRFTRYQSEQKNSESEPRFVN